MFLEKRSYRARRVLDAVRLLPVLGVVLWMVPLMWPGPDAGGAGGTALSQALKYIFGVWVVLIALSLALWRGVRPDRPPPGDGDGPH